MEHKSFRLDLKSVDGRGVFEGYAAVFDAEDLSGEIIEPGAFRKTLQEQTRVPLLWQHRVDEPIGVALEVAEDARGLLLRGQLNLETTRGREAYALLKQGALKGLSIGYDAIKDAWSGARRRLKEVRLWEYSLVTFPMQPLATVTAVKGGAPTADSKGVSPQGAAQDAPGAPRTGSGPLADDSKSRLTHLLREMRHFARTPGSGRSAMVDG